MTNPTFAELGSFAELGLAEPLCRALAAENYAHPTPIQSRAIPLLLEGRDLLGIAQTGTGKTAAFALPILQKLDHDGFGSNRSKTMNVIDSHKRERDLREKPASTFSHPALSKPQQPSQPGSARALILAPTRELAVQIGESFAAYGKHLRLRHTVIFGGVSQFHQVKAMARGVDIIIATPGRLLDLVEQGHVRLSEVQYLVLDEADRMLDMGFIQPMRKIVSLLPKKRQSLLFSATMPPLVAKLAGDILHEPTRVEVTPKVVTVDRIDQRVFFVEANQKRALLLHLLKDETLARVIVFTRTKSHANRVSDQLEAAGIASDAIHGNKSQNARQRALSRLRSGDVRVLVATDIAARGIDVDDVTHVINYELPNEPESYVHRIGRTARAGNDGIAFSFCDASERGFLRDIERLTKRPLAIEAAPAGLATAAPMKPAAHQKPASHHKSDASKGAPRKSAAPGFAKRKRPAFRGKSGRAA